MIPTSILSLALYILAVLSRSEATFTRKTITEETQPPPPYCYALNHHPYLGFASKTSYEEVYNKEGIEPIKNCKAVQLWMVIRHGTRYPGVEDILDFEISKKLQKEVLENHKKKKGTLCTEDLENLRKYNITLKEETANHLTNQGRKDLFGLGQRMRRSFSDIFWNQPYTNDAFQFRFTPTGRTQESAEQFFRGVFGLSFHEEAHPLPVPINDLIYTYNKCPGWEAASAKNKVHRAKFAKTEHIQKVLENVSRRLGFDTNLSHESVKIIYNDCRYYEAWNVDDTSPWCAAFTKEDLLALEYMEDLNYYYKSGPGHPWNLRLACPLVKDMYDHFSDKVEHHKGKDIPRAMFYFSHATLLNQLSAGMGLRDDAEPITEDNYLQKANRNFRTSHIIPFTGNILAVLYKCKISTTERAYKVRFFQGEHVVKYPGCSSGICQWEYIKNKFGPYVNDPLCTDQSFCTSEITKPKTRSDLVIQMIKDNSTTIYISTIGILSAIIVVPNVIGWFR